MIATTITLFHSWIHLWIGRKKISNLATTLSKSSLNGSGTLAGTQGGAASHHGKNSGQQTPLHLCEPYVKASLTTGNLKNIVVWPEHLASHTNEWLAVSAFDFFHNINLLYGTLVSEACTPQRCPTMSAGAGCEYPWVDAQKKSSRVSAPEYVDYVMTWVQSQLDDESIFPMNAGAEFTREFPGQVKAIFRQLFRVFAHIYWHHFDMVLHLEEEAHLNTLFAHFISFAKEYDLLDRKDMLPLQDLIDLLLL